MKGDILKNPPLVPNFQKSKMVKDSPPDVEMKNQEDQSKETKKDTDILTLEDLRDQVKLIEKSVHQKEPRYMMRVLRGLVSMRKRLNTNLLYKAFYGYLPQACRSTLTDYLDNSQLKLDVPGSSVPFRPRTGKAASTPLLVEVEIYLQLLLLLHLIDSKNNQQALKCSDALMKKITLLNRRTLDALTAKCYYYHSQVYEAEGRLEAIRSLLHAHLRTCTLKCDFEGQATLQNLLLRNYLAFNLYDQADKLASKSTFPESASNNEWARYLYYTGRIKAIQLEYSEAKKNLMQALRKAPQSTAIGFRQIVQKFAVVVDLLMGDIPERSIFRQPVLRKTLQQYFQLTQAVRAGDLSRFNEVLESFGPKFEAEGTYTLIIRLRHNVIKTAVRMINLSYSRISLVDIARKLMLGSDEDAEYIVSKAIRDGVIEAVIHHEHGYVQSKETTDIYSTCEPMNAFHQRIMFCLDTHNQSIKAMRFPAKSYSKDLESAEERREREQQELESAKEIADEDFDSFP